MKRRRVLPPQLSYLRVAEEAAERHFGREGAGLSLAPPKLPTQEVPKAIQQHEPPATRAANFEARSRGQKLSAHTRKARAAPAHAPLCPENVGALCTFLKSAVAQGGLTAQQVQQLLSWLEGGGGGPAVQQPQRYY
jgi:hypothetical protein